jgi:hypothetical protein
VSSGLSRTVLRDAGAFLVNGKQTLTSRDTIRDRSEEVSYNFGAGGKKHVVMARMSTVPVLVLCGL